MTLKQLMFDAIKDRGEATYPDLFKVARSAGFSSEMSIRGAVSELIREGRVCPIDLTWSSRGSVRRRYSVRPGADRPQTKAQMRRQRTESELLEMARLADEGHSTRAIGARFGITQQRVSQCLKKIRRNERVTIAKLSERLRRLEVAVFGTRNAGSDPGKG